jgi:hypothetical protein
VGSNCVSFIILVEYHSLQNKMTLEEMYADKYIQLEHKFDTLTTGNLKFINKEIITVR